MLELDSESFENEVINDGGRVFVEFYAEWCRYCKDLATLTEKVKSEFPDIKFCRVNIDKEPELLEKYSVRSVPTSIFFIDSEIANRAVGAITRSELTEILSKEKPTMTV